MPTFEINIIERLERLVSVEAESEEQAIEKVTQDYRDEKIVLDSSDYTDTEFVS
jgi:hypothetical protein